MRAREQKFSVEITDVCAARRERGGLWRLRSGWWECETRTMYLPCCSLRRP